MKDLPGDHAPPPLAELRGAIVGHTLLTKLTTLQDWRVFMTYHVYAVWDFMSLAKRLQRDLTCQTLPWMPPAHPELARFINEIILAEESDRVGDEHMSHCELYLRAMQESGAPTAPFLAFLLSMQGGAAYEKAFDVAETPAAARAFVTQTLLFAQQASTAEVCAVFLWGRENLIPDLFGPLLSLLQQHGRQTRYFQHYLGRHIEIDGDEHGPMATCMAQTMLARADHHADAFYRAAAVALQARLSLWDAIERAIDAARHSDTSAAALVG